MFKILKKSLISKKSGNPCYFLEVVWFGGKELVFIPKEIWDTLPDTVFQA